MATCGYICPSCEGKTFMDDGSACTWCQLAAIVPAKASAITDEEWLQSVYSGPCCSDPGESGAKPDTDSIKCSENG